MIVLRCTQRLAKRSKLQLDLDPPPSTGILGDWYANVLNIGSQRLVLCLSERSLLPVILPARKQEFPRRFGYYLREVLTALQVPPASVAAEVEESQEARFARTANKSLVGALNDFIYHAQVYIDRGETVLEATLHLTEMPSKPIGYDSPDRITTTLFRAARA